MATSAVPAAIDALLAILRAAPGLDGVLIVDGPPGQNLTERHRIYVGFTPGDGPAAELDQSFAYAGARTRNENATIACYAESRSGDKDWAIRRRKVFDLLGAVETALRAAASAPQAPTLDGTVLWSEVTAGSLDQIQSDTGPVAGLTFTVAYRARI